MKHTSVFLSVIQCKINEDLFFGEVSFFGVGKKGGGAVKESFGKAKYMTKLSMNLLGFVFI